MRQHSKSPSRCQLLSARSSKYSIAEAVNLPPIILAPVCFCTGRRELVEYWGAHAQFVRLMAWISCSEPKTRESLLAAWLAERGEAPSPQVLEAAIRRLAVSHTEADVAARIQEARKVLRRYGSMKKKLLGLRVVHVDGEKIGLNRETGMADLDYLIRETCTDRFLGVDLFYMSPGQRRAFYEGIPMAPRLDEVIPNEYAWAGYQLYVLFWRYEPDASIRREVLVPRMEKLAYPTLVSVFMPYDSVYWGLIADSQRDARREEVRRLRDDVAAQFEASRRQLEEKMRRIALEVAKEASSTSPTLSGPKESTGVSKAPISALP